jgi:cell division protein FtsI (penicillin-binding protein 3)/stage V sporulation protein D (sporulation-specific penicillin-binding protein)
MTEAMEAVVIEGTGKRAALEGVRAAGKTGTAQRFNPDTKKYEKGHFVVSFVGFAPVEHPRFACVVILDDPQADDHHELYGGKLAAPLWKDIMTSALAQIGIPAVATTTPGDGQ